MTTVEGVLFELKKDYERDVKYFMLEVNTQIKDRSSGKKG